MGKRNRTVRAEAGNDEEPRRRKSLPLLQFEEFCSTVLQELVARLPPAFPREDFVQELHRYLDYSVKEVCLRGKVKLRVKAIDLPKYFSPPHTGENFEILEQPDFKEVEPLLTDENLTLLDEPMQRLRAKAGSLSINWTIAASVVGRLADRFTHEKRSPGVVRGEFGAKIVQELTRIRDDKRKFQGFEELASAYPTFEVVRMLTYKRFDVEDREHMIRPYQWERVATYAAGLLERYFKKKPDTIKNDRKQYSRWLKNQSTENSR
jgi:hypothetical protein